MVDSTVKNSYIIRIRVRDGPPGYPWVHSRVKVFTLTVKPILTITSSTTLDANEGVNNTTHGIGSRGGGNLGVSGSAINNG
jgi:hypothetical protein